MSINNLYFGATISQIGGSAFYSKALITVSEGYNIGSTSEYISLGDFEVDNFQNAGANDQLLQLNLTAKDLRTNSNTTYLDRAFPSNFLLADYFVDPNTLNTNYSQISGIWGISNGLLTTTIDENIQHEIFCTQSTNIEDSLIIAKFKSDSWGVSSGFITRGGIIFRNQLDSNSSGENNYTLRIEGNPINQLVLYRQGSATDNPIGSTALFSTSFTPTNNIYYWLMVSAIKNQLRIYTSINGVSYNLQTSIVDTTFPKGGVGFTALGISGVNWYFDSIEVTELTNQQTTKSISTSAFALGNVPIVNIPNDLDTFANFITSPGSSWVAGTSNNYFLNNTGSGTTWHMLATQGSTLMDFVANFEMRGSSGTQAGVMIGVSSQFYANYYNFVPTIGTTVRNAFVNAIFGGSNYTNTVFNGRGDYVTLLPNTFYKVQVMKTGLFFGTYINGKLSNSIYGTSYLNLTYSPVDIGMVAPSNNIAGSTIEFRNFSISQLDESLTDIQLSANENIQSLLDRYLPIGFVHIWSQNQVNIFKTGSSRGLHDIGLSTFLQFNTHTRNNTQGIHIIILNGANYAGQYINPDTDQTNQLDSMRVNFINDQSITSSSNANSIASAYVEQNNPNIVQFTVITNARVDLELYDQVSFIDPSLGISGLFHVYNSIKSYSAETGDFNHTLTLGV